MCPGIDLTVATQANDYIDCLRSWFQQRHAFRQGVSLALRSHAEGLPSAARRHYVNGLPAKPVRVFPKIDVPLSLRRRWQHYPNLIRHRFDNGSLDDAIHEIEQRTPGDRCQRGNVWHGLSVPGIGVRGRRRRSFRYGRRVKKAFFRTNAERVFNLNNNQGNK